MPIVSAAVGPVQLARGTSGPGRWYRPVQRRFRRDPGYHGLDGHAAARDSTDAPGSTDTLGRAMRDLRISVTDRCNFRCTYCMPKEIFGRDYAFLPRDQVLTFEEIDPARAGVRRARRREAADHRRRTARPARPADLIAMLAAIRRPDGGAVDLTLTTNGSALRALAGPLADAGLQRVTVSLDSLDDAVFGAMNGIDFPVAQVLDGIAAAAEAGLAPVKVNMVVRRGINESSVVPMARLGARDGRHPALHRVHGRRPLEWLAPRRGRPGRGAARRRSGPSGRSSRPIPATAARSPIAGATSTVGGEFGVISSVTQPFCRDCTRARISAEGMLYTCLFAVDGHDARAVLRSGAVRRGSATRSSRRIWTRRGDRYSELRSAATSTLPKVEMFAMGG